MLPYKFISEFMPAVRAPDVSRCCKAAAAGEVEPDDVPPDPLGENVGVNGNRAGP